MIPTKWPLTHVMAVHPGADGIVRLYHSSRKCKYRIVQSYYHFKAIRLGRRNVEVIRKFQLSFRIPTNSQTHDPYAYLIFSCSHSCFILFHFCQGLISVNSIRRVRVLWLYNETPALQKSSSYSSYRFVSWQTI